MSDSDLHSVELQLAAAVATLPAHLKAIAAEFRFPVLHRACMEGEIELVRALLDAGIAPDLYPQTDDDEDQPPLTWLASDRVNAAPNALAVVALLIERCESIDEGEPLIAALEASDLSVARMLLAAGADEDRPHDELGESDSYLLHGLTAPAWRVPVGYAPSYFIAFDEDQRIEGVGPTPAAAISLAHGERPDDDFQVLPASEHLVAQWLRGEDASWLEVEGVAVVDDEAMDP